jgi:hypothetical protein
MRSSLEAVRVICGLLGAPFNRLLEEIRIQLSDISWGSLTEGLQLDESSSEPNPSPVETARLLLQKVYLDRIEKIVSLMTGSLQPEIEEMYGSMRKDLNRNRDGLARIHSIDGAVLKTLSAAIDDTKGEESVKGKVADFKKNFCVLLKKAATETIQVKFADARIKLLEILSKQLGKKPLPNMDPDTSQNGFEGVLSSSNTTKTPPSASGLEDIGKMAETKSNPAQVYGVMITDMLLKKALEDIVHAVNEEMKSFMESIIESAKSTVLESVDEEVTVKSTKILLIYSNLMDLLDRKVIDMERSVGES